MADVCLHELCNYILRLWIHSTRESGLLCTYGAVLISAVNDQDAVGLAEGNSVTTYVVIYDVRTCEGSKGRRDGGS